MILHIDFETFSAADLTVVGLDNYAKHSSTGVHCMAYVFDDGAVDLWVPGMMSPDALEHVEAGGLVYCHNASFELAIWNNVCVPKYGWPPLKLEQMRCTMAMAYAMSLPGSLDKSSAALGVDMRKDIKGSRVMLQLAQPKADGAFWSPADAPEKFNQLYDYCKQDVEVERAIHGRLMELSDAEQAVWQLDQRINQRGVQIDLKAVNEAIKLVNSEKKRLDADMLRVTGGDVGRCTEVLQLVKWIRSQGVEVKGLAKADVLDALRDDSLPANVKAALNLRREAAKSSTAKLVAMRDAASSDGRVRGMFQYHGANTGRWAGRRVQLQNMTRGGLAPADVEDAINHFNNARYLDMMYGSPLDVISSCLRGMITASEGKDLVAVDFSAIEARVLAWLAGQESVLEIFRTHGKIYEHAAADIYDVPMANVDKAQRQIGKVAVLALGYGGGVGAFQSMARVYGVKVADAEADKIKAAWREANTHITRYWYDLESAAVNAVQLGCVCYAGHKDRRVAFKLNGSFLWCKLPSGRVLCYPYPEVREVEVPWGGTKPALFYWCVNGTTKKWEETSTYGGSLSENVTQAVARDLLAEAMLRLASEGFDICSHVHDEVVVEVPAGDSALKEVEEIMTQAPAWAKGLPLAAEGWRAKRYKK